MATVTMVMPRMGESVIEATVLKWLKQEGDMIMEEESVVEVATDKVDSEVPAPYAGRLQQVLVQKGEVVKIGAPLAIIATEEEPLKISSPPPTTAEPPLQPVSAHLLPPTSTTKIATLKQSNGRFYSPLVRYIAQQEQITPQVLSQIPGTGKNNRVTKRDLLAYLESRFGGYKALEPTAADVLIAPEDEVVKLDRVRQMIAEYMIASKRIVPHVTSFVEADVTNLVQWRSKNKESFEQKTDTKLTYTPLFIKAIVRALKDFSMINALMVRNQIIKKKAINIGLAVALPDGNLIVPVIRHADRLSLVELVRQVNNVAHRARHRQLVPDELTGATYTISNLGSFQNLMGTPIIPQPQVAIMALGTIVKKPAVVEDDQGDTISIRHKMYLSHAYDHRVIDGALGGGFAKRVADYLESFVDWVCW